MDSFIKDPITTQQNILKSLIDEARNTVYGTAHYFDTIGNVDTFRKRVPINQYKDLYPYIERVLRGEQQVLWPSQINWFAKSSGTSGAKSKFIPVSREALDDNHFKAGKDVLSLYVKQFPNSGVFNGKCLTIGGSHTINQMSPDSYYGDLSAVMLQNMPFIGQLMRAPELSIALMENWNEKLDSIIANTQHENITYIAGVPTWTLVLLKKLLQQRGVQDIREIWPQIELYLHGGVSFTPYKSQFKTLIPHYDMHYMETYNASEGFFAAQNDLTDPGLLLFLNHGIYFEFLPLDELNAVHPRTALLDEVETNKQYALVISTNAGLWRYMPGDTITFTSLNPYKIKVSGRTTQFINAFGEEVIVANTDTAIASAAQATQAIVNDYMAGPVYFNDRHNGTHEWIIEFEKAPDNPSLFKEILDDTLKKLNSDYEAKRFKNMALTFPIIHFVPKGSFNQWMQKKGKLGGQNKVPRLSNDRRQLEDALLFMNIRS